ncbi:hypothetical protein TNCV_4424591 [Trichonephila clavipes]|nr:hypothetical protein TNCV_4424591 [Trichonephila clavipes]
MTHSRCFADFLKYLRSEPFLLVAPFAAESERAREIPPPFTFQTSQFVGLGQMKRLQPAHFTQNTNVTRVQTRPELEAQFGPHCIDVADGHSSSRVFQKGVNCSCFVSKYNTKYEFSQSEPFDNSKFTLRIFKVSDYHQYC